MTLLAERAGRLVAGEEVDPVADIERYVERFWPEPLRLAGRAGDADGAALLIANPGAASRLLTGLSGLAVDGREVPLRSAVLVNETPGETGIPVAVRTLSPESGMYVRHAQAAELRLGMPVDARFDARGARRSSSAASRRASTTRWSRSREPRTLAAPA